MIKTSKFLGRSAAAFQLARSIVKAAPTEASVLLIGESGTGKEVVAHAIHSRSSRRNFQFVAINCGAISPSLAESELFGHEKGSFTGADRQHKGCFERANTGTLFLDEITEMPLEMQVKLLRVLETGEYHRVGGSTPLKVNVRIISATNRDPKKAILAGKLRSDLLYRLAVFPMRVPPLRERKVDIGYLAQRFLNELNEQEKTEKIFSNTTIARLESYNWPGNIRELKNTITRSFILADDEVDVKIATLRQVRGQKLSSVAQDRIKIAVGTSLAAAQRTIIVATLNYYSGDRRRTALTLGITEKTLFDRLKLFQEHGYAV